MNSKSFLALMVYCVYAITYDHDPKLSSALMMGKTLQQEHNSANTTTEAANLAEAEAANLFSNKFKKVESIQSIPVLNQIASKLTSGPKGKRHADIYNVLIDMKKSINDGKESASTTANTRCSGDASPEKDMTEEKDFGDGSKFVDLVGCDDASECEKSTKEQQDLAVAAYKKIVVLKTELGKLKDELKDVVSEEEKNNEEEQEILKKKNQDESLHLARMKKFTNAIDKLNEIDSYLDAETGKISIPESQLSSLISEEEKNVIKNFKVGHLMLLMLKSSQEMTGAEEKELVITLKQLLSSCVETLEASRANELKAHQSWMKYIDEEIETKKDAAARLIADEEGINDQIAKKELEIKEEEEKKEKALDKSNKERELCLNTHKDFIESMKDFNLEIDAIDKMLKILEEADLEAETAVIRDETEEDGDKKKHGVKESLKLGKCGAAPSGQVLLGDKTEDSFCANAKCTQDECFEDVGKCGAVPDGKVYLSSKTSESPCVAATCEDAECFEDVGKCGAVPDGKVYLSSKTSESPCVAATCEDAECFEDVAQCQTPPTGKKFKDKKTSTSKCTTATCKEEECFEDDVARCGNRAKSRGWDFYQAYQAYKPDKDYNSTCGSKTSCSQRDCFEDVINCFRTQVGEIWVENSQGQTKSGVYNVKLSVSDKDCKTCPRNTFMDEVGTKISGRHGGGKAVYYRAVEARFPLILTAQIKELHATHNTLLGPLTCNFKNPYIAKDMVHHQIHPSGEEYDNYYGNSEHPFTCSRSGTDHVLKFTVVFGASGAPHDKSSRECV